MGQLHDTTHAVEQHFNAEQFLMTSYSNLSILVISTIYTWFDSEPFRMSKTHGRWCPPAAIRHHTSTLW